MRILLADDETKVRYGLRVLLEERAELEVVGEAADAGELLAQLEEACPDLLLLNWGLPGLADADLLPVLRRICNDVHGIVLSGRAEARQAALDAGANAFISKVESPEQLLAAIASAENANRKGDYTKENLSMTEQEKVTRLGSARLSRLQPVAVTKRQDRRIRNLYIVVFLLVLVASLFVAISVKAISGENTQYVLEANRTRIGILILDRGASAILREGSSWIGLIVSPSGRLIVEERATIIGPVCLGSGSLRLEENARVRGSVYLLSSGLTLEPGASVSRDAILFSGSVELGDGATIRDDVVLFSGSLRLGDGAVVQDDAFLFSGSVELDDRAALGGDALLVSGSAQIGREATADGDLVLFAGRLVLGDNAVLHDDAVLLAGDLHQQRGALVEGDVLLAVGYATMEDQSVISGRLLLNPEPRRGNVHQASDAQVDGGISYPDSINSISGLRVAAFFLRQSLKRILPLAAVILVLVLLVYLRQHRRARALADESASFS